MKIKCPFEPFEKAPDYTERELSIHLHEDHETREIIADYYCRLLFKIHEKIESLQNMIDALKKDNRFDHYIINRLEVLEGKQEELKSLLEDEK